LGKKTRFSGRGSLPQSQIVVCGAVHTRGGIEGRLERWLLP
jgi:hypothetical protein